MRIVCSDISVTESHAEQTGMMHIVESSATQSLPLITQPMQTCKCGSVAKSFYIHAAV